MNTATNNEFQPMPDLTDDQLDALRADIAKNGIIVPVVVDQHGRVLDGHNRRAIAAELGIDCPVEIRHVGDDDEAADLALALNCARRHLTQEQRRELIRNELVRRPEDSDRAIGRRVGCDHKTVGAVRRAQGGEIPHPAPAAPYEPPTDVDHDLKAAVLQTYSEMNLKAELPESDELDEWCQTAFLYDVDDELAFLLLLASPADPVMVATAVIGRMGMWKARGIDRRKVRELFEPWIDQALSPSAREQLREDKFFGPLAESVDDELLDRLVERVASVPLMGSGPVPVGGAR